MTSLLKFGSREGKERSLLALYILHSLSKSPKSGYDLIAEIKAKTGGLWIPARVRCTRSSTSSRTNISSQ